MHIFRISSTSRYVFKKIKKNDTGYALNIEKIFFFKTEEVGPRGKTNKNAFLFVFLCHILNKSDKNKKSMKNEQRIN
jgi:hypothetical protein